MAIRVMDGSGKWHEFAEGASVMVEDGRYLVVRGAAPDNVVLGGAMNWVMWEVMPVAAEKKK